MDRAACIAHFVLRFGRRQKASVRRGGPLFVVGRRHFDRVDENPSLRTGVGVFDQNILGGIDLLDLLPPKWISVDLTERDPEFIVLFLSRLRLDHDILVADDKVGSGVVAGLIPEAQPERGDFSVVGSIRSADTNPQVSLFGKSETEIEGGLLPAGKDEAKVRTGFGRFRWRFVRGVGATSEVGSIARNDLVGLAIEVVGAAAPAGRFLLLVVLLLLVLRGVVSVGLLCICRKIDMEIGDRGFRALDHGFAKCFSRNLVIVFELGGGHLEHLRAVLEPVFGGSFGWEVTREVEGQPKQILERIVVFVLGQASERGVPFFESPDLRGDLDLVRQPVDDPGSIFISQLDVFLIRGRHLATADHIEDFEPPADVLAGGKIGVQRIEAEVGLLFFGAVTSRAGLFEERADLLLKGCEVRLWRLIRVSSGRSRCQVARIPETDCFGFFEREAMSLLFAEKERGAFRHQKQRESES